MAKTSSAEKVEYWRLVLDEHRLSGMSVKDFCDQQELATRSFYEWRKKIFDQGRTKSPESSIVSADLIPVRVVEPDPSASKHSNSPMPIDINTPAGFTLRVDMAMKTHRLTELLEAVMRCSNAGSRSC